jgi:hypothetical protein
MERRPIVESRVGRWIVGGRFSGLWCKVVLVVGVVAGVLAGMGGSVATATLGGEFAGFSECPMSDPVVSGCIAAHLEGGSVTLGRETLPIVNTVTLQTGFSENEKTSAIVVVDPILYRVPQKLPGGLYDVNCTEIVNLEQRERCESNYENARDALWATLELAEPGNAIGLNEANLIGGGSGVGLSLPVKIRLENQLLGSQCYLGSNTDPIVLALTAGVSGSLHGHLGHATFNHEGVILTIRGSTFVDNSFAVPSATGCVGLGNALIDARLGLPARPGISKVTLLNTVEQAGAEAILEHSR